MYGYYSQRDTMVSMEYKLHYMSAAIIILAPGCKLTTNALSKQYVWISIEYDKQQIWCAYAN
ncbi:316_t:CDS:2 [Cetraspora pellucida]|uniref:316_t:CDS:1 n=1 Tax=Cetraspora pellucida TaxID=1433469 RepID=A0A9N9CMN3_9GLOM|nr:316_t:CDS:2 [Cetraspora pellucida]